jgi:hypothetical protein
MKQPSLVILILVWIMSCKDKPSSPAPFSDLVACGVKDPVQNLPWLKKIIDDAKSRKDDQFLTITMFEIDKKPVFYKYISYESCWGCVFFLCDGSLIDQGKLTATELDDFQKKKLGNFGTSVVVWPQK